MGKDRRGYKKVVKGRKHADMRDKERAKRRGN